MRAQTGRKTEAAKGIMMADVVVVIFGRLICKRRVCSRRLANWRRPPRERERAGSCLFCQFAERETVGETSHLVYMLQCVDFD